jgi:glycerol-3-phosphate acyltransferase PlsY
LIDLAWQDAWILPLAYGLGCFSTGYYLVRWRTGEDIRTLGSGSTGARNVGRTLGTTGFILTVLGDAGKGVLAVGIPLHSGLPAPAGALCALAVALGHIFPAQLGFSGGKGVAVALGALVALDPRLVLAFALAAILGYVASRRTVAAGLVGFLSVTPAAWLRGSSIGVCLVLFALVALIFWAHRKNIVFLFQGRSGAGA